MSPASSSNKNRKRASLPSSGKTLSAVHGFLVTIPVLLLVICLLAPSSVFALEAARPLEASSGSFNEVASAGLQSVRILALNATPVASAGPDQNVTPGSRVTLNASASVPSDGATIVNYTWKVTYEAATVTYYDSEISFWANKTGLFTAILTIRDSSNQTASDKAYIFVKEPPKTFIGKYWLLILFLGVVALISGYILFVAVRRSLSGQPVVSEAAREKFKLSLKKIRKINSQLLRNPMGLIGAIVLTFFILMALFGHMLAPYSVDLASSDPRQGLKLPSSMHWMGTDSFGLDIFSELLNGARTSITVGIVAALIASFLGAAVGLYSGYVGGWKDEVIMRLNDVVLSIPWLVLMIIVAAFIGKIDLTGIILIIGLTGWSTTARMVRAQVLSVRERQFVERARAIGASEMNIIRRHIFPNTFPLVFANTILTVAVSILSEATLSFLGLRPAGVVTWGTMLSYASEAGAFKNGLQMWILAPGLCIVAVVLGFTLLGYALDEILNPKLRRR